MIGQHRYAQDKMRPTVTLAAWSVSLSLDHEHELSKTAEPIEMPPGGSSRAAAAAAARQAKQGIAPGAARRYAPPRRWQFDGGKNRGGSTSVRGRVRSPRETDHAATTVGGVA